MAKARRRPLSESRPRAEKDEPERRCIVTGEHGTKASLLRFVAGPDGVIYPDLKGRLPGRGLWVTIDRKALRRAIDKRLFARAARSEVKVPATLESEVERQLVKSAQGLLGLAFKAGEVAVGFAKVEDGLARGRFIALVEASDAAPHGTRKLVARADQLDVPVMRALSAMEMGLALGRENMVHAGLNEGRLARRFLEDARRLELFRGGEGASAGVAVLHAKGVQPRNEE